MSKKFILITLFLALIILASSVYFFQNKTLLKVVDDSWNTLELSRELKQVWNQNNSYVEDGESATFQLGAWQIIFSKTKDQKEQIRALQEVVTRLRMDTSQAKMIDLRFAKVVIKDL